MLLRAAVLYVSEPERCGRVKGHRVNYEWCRSPGFGVAVGARPVLGNANVDPDGKEVGAVRDGWYAY